MFRQGQSMSFVLVLFGSACLKFRMYLPISTDKSGHMFRFFFITLSCCTIMLRPCVAQDHAVVPTSTLDLIGCIESASQQGAPDLGRKLSSCLSEALNTCQDSDDAKACVAQSAERLFQAATAVQIAVLQEPQNNLQHKILYRQFVASGSGQGCDGGQGYWQSDLPVIDPATQVSQQDVCHLQRAAVHLGIAFEIIDALGLAEQ